MDFGLIALVLVIAREVLNYIAPKTKTKVDDKIRDGANALPLPSLHDAIHQVTDKDKPPVAKPVEGFGVARDHRSK